MIARISSPRILLIITATNHFIHQNCKNFSKGCKTKGNALNFFVARKILSSQLDTFSDLGSHVVRNKLFNSFKK
jgi:hypothetical protein